MAEHMTAPVQPLPMSRSLTLSNTLGGSHPHTTLHPTHDPRPYAGKPLGRHHQLLLRVDFNRSTRCIKCQTIRPNKHAWPSVVLLWCFCDCLDERGHGGHKPLVRSWVRVGHCRPSTPNGAGKTDDELRVEMRTEMQTRVEDERRKQASSQHGHIPPPNMDTLSHHTHCLPPT